MKLFLDDQWDDPETTDRFRMPEGYISAATSAEAITLVEQHGLPSHMSLDFDLGIVDGKQDSAETFLRWLSDRYPDGPIPEWQIHSKNVMGQEWIRSWMRSWEKSLKM